MKKTQKTVTLSAKGITNVALNKKIKFKVCLSPPRGSCKMEMVIRLNCKASKRPRDVIKITLFCIFVVAVAEQFSKDDVPVNNLRQQMSV